MGSATFQPKWWTEKHGSQWENLKQALKRDWEQTKKDLHMGGHELNQSVTDTLGQAAGVGSTAKVQEPLAYKDTSLPIESADIIDAPFLGDIRKPAASGASSSAPTVTPATAIPAVQASRASFLANPRCKCVGQDRCRDGAEEASSAGA